MVERVRLQVGYVIHQRPFRESSLLLEVLTPDFGRKGLVAKGVRGERSKLRGVLQVCRPLLVSWSGRGELGSLTGAEPAGPAHHLVGRQLWCALYLNELIQRLVPREDPNPLIYGSYARTLADLARDRDEEAVLRVFERDLLAQIGYGLSLDREADTGRPIAADARYDYRLEQGPVRTGGGGAALELSGRTLLDLQRGDLSDPQSRHEAKRLTRAAIAPHLGGRPLKSRELFESRRGPRTSPAMDSE
jgi:DNA repair protein RecO (recombination protein O)